MRRCRSQGDSQPEALVLATHFGESVYTTAAMTQIDPEHEYSMMLDDGPLADGVMLWWDELGLARQIATQQGIFGESPSPAAAAFPLYTAFRGYEPSDLVPVGWFARYHYAGQDALKSLRVAVKDGPRNQDGAAFAKVVVVGGATVYNATGGCNDTVSWAARPCPAGEVHDDSASFTCTSECHAAVETITVTARHRGVAARSRGGGTFLGLRAAAPISRSFGCMWAPSVGGGVGTTASSWRFESGLDESVSTLQATHRAIQNATKMLLSCRCD